MLQTAQTEPFHLVPKSLWQFKAHELGMPWTAKQNEPHFPSGHFCQKGRWISKEHGSYASPHRSVALRGKGGYSENAESLIQEFQIDYPLRHSWGNLLVSQARKSNKGGCTAIKGALLPCNISQGWCWEGALQPQRVVRQRRHYSFRGPSFLSQLIKRVFCVPGWYHLCGLFFLFFKKRFFIWAFLNLFFLLGQIVMLFN